MRQAAGRGPYILISGQDKDRGRKPPRVGGSRAPAPNEVLPTICTYRDVWRPSPLGVKGLAKLATTLVAYRLQKPRRLKRSSLTTKLSR